MKILVLEDNEVLSKVIKTGLEKEHYNVDCFFDGDKALDAINNGYNCFILDINVPSLDGISVLKNIRDYCGDVPVLIISSNHELEKIKTSYEKGCNDYIKKPFDLDEFLARIKAVLKRKNPTIIYNDIIFDLFDKRVMKSNKEVSLGLVEKEIFSLLIQNINKTVNKSVFFECMNKPSDMALRAVISKLKKILSNSLRWISLTNSFL